MTIAPFLTLLAGPRDTKVVVPPKRVLLTLAYLMAVLAPSWSVAQMTQRTSADVLNSGPEVSALPDAPSSSQVAQSQSFGEKLGEAAKTIGSDELHILKSPFKKSAIKWDILVVGATAALIATDERVIHEVPTSWHDTSITASNVALGATAATAGGIYVAGLISGDDHAKEAGVRTAEATIDSVILYGAMKAIFARQRPFTGDAEGKFFSGNWTNGSFPSGHAMFTWTVASTIAHEYHSPWLKILMYGMATTVSTTRVTSREHFPSDVFVGSVLGYGIGTYVAHKDSKPHDSLHSQNLLKRVPEAIMDHVTIGGQ